MSSKILSKLKNGYFRVFTGFMYDKI